MLSLYSCPVCNKIILVVQDGKGELVCCNKPMIRLEEKTADAGKEKHLPVIEKVAGGIKVKVGAVPHPMEKEHYIRWVEVIGDTFLFTQTFTPGNAPEKVFVVPPGGHVQKVRALCNVHGLWAAKP
ncbi:MAG: desulfoferrodoxin [Methanomicrobiales archaeon]|nr:desulfoferrodoxin [Methanomicrobiales archaeon]